MANFKPQVTFVTEESYRDYRNHRINSPYVTKRFNTFAELKKEIPGILKEHLEYADEPIHVLRSRRGEWGEWNEKWSLVNGKPIVVSSTWS
jgi:predicted NodU family carbamoyl transferase